ncbi:YjiH family protein [Bacillus sp. REN16]|uniref:YjiH family protein n=1 Tax=Bacillus sp. REN16 TaxID=2887296 RepID=UPI001E54137E|nr:YjiH family protein [Bacillus sp. REN16]MCC3359156.1 YjiH family protein [Bacillus sp. REN16]
MLGIFIFFIPVTIGGTSSIMLDHIVTAIRNTFPSIVPFYALMLVLLGAVYPFVTKQWNNSNTDIVFSIFKVLGLIFATLIYFNWGPGWLLAEDSGQFLYDKLIIPLSLLVPIGSAFLILIVGYGLLEFIGVLCRPIMRPVWKTPGRSAVDAVASFVGSYSIGLLITNRVYKEGKYSIKEAAIIATGFSTVSAPFMIVVAKTLGLMEIWNLYFWSALVTTFLVTMISIRIPPLSKKSTEFYLNKPNLEPEVKSNLIKNAWKEGMDAAGKSPSILSNLQSNMKDGFKMTMNVLPTGMSIGLIGILLSKYTPIFDIFGYLFLPFTYALQIPEPMLAAKAASLSIVEMFMPSLLIVSAPLITKFVLGIVTVASIIFFAGTIPCIVATDIPIKMSELVIIWFQRTVLALIIATPIAYIFL